MSDKLLYRDESYRIMGACFEVHNDKGCGFLEAVYQECLALEFDIQGIPYRPQVELGLSYKGRPLAQTYRPDFLCYDKIVVELKAVKQLTDDHRAQTLNYSKATGLRLALLVNFGRHPKLEYERLAL
jgi:GxxExxY protein